MQSEAQERIGEIVPARDGVELSADEPSLLGGADKPVAERHFFGSGIRARVLGLIDFRAHGAKTKPRRRGSQGSTGKAPSSRYVGTSDCSMESGTLRVDANISIRPQGMDQMNTKVEVKNVNSIRHLGDAISCEIQRQMALLRTGEPIVLHTRLWDPEKGVTAATRAKFEDPYVPDPCVAQIQVTEAWLKELQSRLPEMPGQKAERSVRQYGLTRDEALSVAAEGDVFQYFEALSGLGIKPKMATHWLATQFLPALKEHGQIVLDTAVKQERFATPLFMLERNEINANTAKEVLNRLFESDESPTAIVDRSDFHQISDTSALEDAVGRVLAANASAVVDFRNGVSKALGFLVGQAMQASGGKAKSQAHPGDPAQEAGIICPDDPREMTEGRV